MVHIPYRPVIPFSASKSSFFFFYDPCKARCAHQLRKTQSQSHVKVFKSETNQQVKAMDYVTGTGKNRYQAEVGPGPAPLPVDERRRLASGMPSVGPAMPNRINFTIHV